MVLLQILVKNMERKNNLRKEKLKLRKEMTPLEVTNNSHSIVEYLIRLDIFQKADHILLYAPTQNEVDTNELFLYAISQGKKVYYPRVNGLTMNFYEVNNLAQLEVGAYGIMEPKQECTCFVHHSNCCMIVPGVVFDGKGYRIGYGKGFYDRFLAEFTDISTIGVCFDLQMTDSVPFEEFDIQLDYVITERTE